MPYRQRLYERGACSKSCPLYNLFASRKLQWYTSICRLPSNCFLIRHNNVHDNPARSAVSLFN
jgi:hypothetical protein